MEILSWDRNETGCIDITLLDTSKFMSQHYIHAHLLDFTADIRYEGSDDRPPAEVKAFIEWIIDGITASIHKLDSSSGVGMMHNSATGAVAVEFEDWHPRLMEILEDADGCDEEELSVLLLNAVTQRIWLPRDRQLQVATALAKLHGMKLIPAVVQSE